MMAAFCIQRYAHVQNLTATFNILKRRAYAVTVKK